MSNTNLEYLQERNPICFEFVGIRIGTQEIVKTTIETQNKTDGKIITTGKD